MIDSGNDIEDELFFLRWMWDWAISSALLTPVVKLVYISYETTTGRKVPEQWRLK